MIVSEDDIFQICPEFAFWLKQEDTRNSVATKGADVKSDERITGLKAKGDDRDYRR